MFPLKPTFIDVLIVSYVFPSNKRALIGDYRRVFVAPSIPWMLHLSRQSCRSQCDQQIPSTESSKMIDDKSPRSVDGFFHGKKHRKADGTFNTYTWSCFFGGKHIWIWITYEYSMGKSKIRVVEVLNGKSCIMFMGDVPAVAMWHWLPEGTLR